MAESAVDDAVKSWQSQADSETVEQTVDTFKILKQRQIVKGAEADISGWVKKPFKDFQSFVDQLNQKHQQKSMMKQSSSDADKVFENDKVLIVSPNTYEASCKYGADTEWCTTGKTRSHWDNYTKHNIKFYYLINKTETHRSRLSKIAVAVYIGAAAMEVYDANDILIKDTEFDKILQRLGIDKKIFTNTADWGKYWGKWLKQNKHTKNADGTIDIEGSVDLSYQSLTKIPFKFGKVGGDFYCDDNQLKSLEGAPSRVGGNFYCDNNQLKSLEGAPSSVVGSFDCRSNHLKTLAGAPSSVDGGFYCYGNKLKTLEGAPSRVGGNFNCSGNRLESLEGAPSSVGKGFDCIDNPKLKQSEIDAYKAKLKKVQVIDKSIKLEENAMKYKDFYLNEHESDGPIAIDADQLTTQPCEDIAGLTIGRELTDKDKAGLISARGVFPKNNEKEIYEKNLIKAKELLNKINMVKDQRGAKTKLMALGITGSQIAAIISGLNYSGKSVYSTDEGKAIVKELLPLLKNIFKVGVCSVLNKSTMDEALILKRSGDDLVVVSDLDSRQLQSAETYRHKNELKKHGFSWDSGLNSWKISATEFDGVQQLLAKINKKPLEVIINTIDELPEFIMNSDNVSRKSELATQIEGFINDLSNEVTEAAMSEKIMQFLSFQRKFRIYSITNSILIYLQKKDATKVAGFKAWQEKFHRQVKKGAKAITIFAPKTFKKEVDEIDDKDLDASVRTVKVMGFRPVSVFDISDTEPIDATGEVPSEPEWHAGNEPSAVADRVYVASEQLAKELGINLTQADADKGEQGYSAGDHINISSNVAGVNKLGTVIHELAHELLHHEGKSLFYIKVPREIRELQAEAVSYVVLRHFDIPAEHQSTYITLFRNNKADIEKNLNIIKKASNFIVDRIDEISKEHVK